MCRKLVKTTVIAAVAVLVIGGVMFGSDLCSYARSSARTVQSAVKDAVPIEFELRRARDMLTDIVPEMQANIRLIAREEVEVAELQSDIAECTQRVATERDRIARVRDMLDVEQASYQIGQHDYTRTEVMEDLSNRFERFRESELVLAGKDRLLKTRQQSLRAAITTLERTRAQKQHLEDQVAALEAQFRVIQAASVGSQLQVDDTALAKADKLIRDIRKRLDVAERVLAHEAKYTSALPVDEAVDQQDLLTQVDEYFAQDQTSVAQSEAAPDGELDKRLAAADMGEPTEQ